MKAVLQRKSLPRLSLAALASIAVLAAAAGHAAPSPVERSPATLRDSVAGFWAIYDGKGAARCSIKGSGNRMNERFACPKQVVAGIDEEGPSIFLKHSPLVPLMPPA